MSNETTITIIRALVNLVNVATFQVDADGAEKIAGLRQNAVKVADELEAEDAIEGEDND